jgi:hypothetical protein
MAITSFIPEIWNAQLLTDFREQTVAASLANREYEGNASAGNVVRINSATAVAINNYATGEGGVPRTTAADAVSTTSQDLLIDQEKSFDFYIDDIDKAQAAGGMDAFTRSAGEGLAEDADRFILAAAVTAANAGNTETGAALTTGDAAFNILRDLRKALNKQKVPQGQRVAIVNAEFEAVLLEAASKLTAVDTSGSPAGLREASLGRILGFDIYVSENLPTVSEQQVLAFYRPALAYVSQIEKTEAMRANDKFADRLRGLHVYGGKVVRPTAVAQWTATAA